jgi:hypothetical protein
MVALLTFLAGPIGRWLIITAIVAAALGGTYFKIKQIGWDEREAVAQAEAKEAERLAAALGKRRVEVTERVVIEYRDRVKVVRQQGEEIIREVEKLVPVGSCDLPSGFRVLHDAAVTGSLPRPSLGTDAAAVSAQDAAYTVVANYTVCHDTAERLIALQRWVKEQERVH